MPRMLIAILLLPMTALTLTFASCGQDFEPVSLLTGPRILAMIADPLAVGPTDSVTITPVRYLGDISPQAEGWSFCPFTLGPAAGYRCAVPECELALDASSDASLTAVPGELAAQCIASFEGLGDLPAGLPAELPPSFEVLFSYWMQLPDGQEQRAVLSLPLWPAGAPASSNQHPVLGSVTIAGQAAQAEGLLAPLSLSTDGLDVPVVVSTLDDSLEEFIDGAGQARVEEALVSLYATAGAFDFERLAGSTVSAVWTLADVEPGTIAELWVVVRDGRGGQAAGGPYLVPVEP